MCGDDPQELEGKVAVVTGAGGVLCSGMAEALARAGAAVALLDLRPEAAQAVADRINRAGGKALAVKANVLDKKDVQTAEQTVRSSLARPISSSTARAATAPRPRRSPISSFSTCPRMPSDGFSN